MNIAQKNQEIIKPFLTAMYDFDELAVRSFIEKTFSIDVKIHICHPFGDAVTAQIAAIEPPTEAVSVIRERRMSYYRAMSECVKPSIAVVEDLDYPNCIGAFWGEVNTAIHKGFGMSGALTNGVMRDLGDMAEDFPVVAGSIGPSHGFVHVRSVNQPIKVFGLNIKSDDLVHADRHGAVIIPTGVIQDLESSILKMQETEKLVLNPARKKGFDFNAFEAAWNDFEKVRT